MFTAAAIVAVIFMAATVTMLMFMIMRMLMPVMRMSIIFWPTVLFAVRMNVLSVQFHFSVPLFFLSNMVERLVEYRLNMIIGKRVKNSFAVTAALDESRLL